MSASLIERLSSHVIIAPPAPSGMSEGLVWSPTALHTITPLTAHNVFPNPSTRWAKMSYVPTRFSVQHMMAPPAPSDAHCGPLGCPLVNEIGIPFTTQSARAL